MPSHVLIPFDGTPQSEAALTFAVEEWPDAAVTLLHVVDPVTAGFGQRALPGSSETWYEDARETARGHFEDARALAGRPVRTRLEVPPASSSTSRARTRSTTSSSGATAGTASHASCSGASPKASPAGHRSR